MRQHQKQHTKLGLVLNGIVSREDLRSYRPSDQPVEIATDGQGWEIAPTVVTDEPLHYIREGPDEESSSAAVPPQDLRPPQCDGCTWLFGVEEEICYCLWCGTLFHTDCHAHHEGACPEQRRDSFVEEVQLAKGKAKAKGKTKGKSKDRLDLGGR